MIRRVALAAAIFCAGSLLVAEERKDEQFTFPNDRGGKLLSQVLSPSLPVTCERCQKRDTRGPARIEVPTLPSSTVAISLPLLPAQGPRQALQPGHVAEDVPFSPYRLGPRL